MSIPPASSIPPVDLSLVREYLSLPTTGQLVQTAATLSRSSEGTEQDLILKAMRLHTSGDITLLNKRIDLLHRMNDATRTALSHIQGIDPVENRSYPEMHMKDVGLAYFYHVAHPAHVINSAQSIHQLKEGGVEAAFAELNLSVSSRPWTLDSILRTVANADDSAILQQAFEGYWAVAHHAEEDHYSLLRKQDSLAHFEKQAEEPTLVSYRESIRAHIGDLKREIKGLEVKHQKRASFYPSQDLDPVFDQDRKEFEPFKHSSDDLGHDQVIAILTSGFRDFWNAHAEAYQKLSRQRSQAREQYSRRQGESGEKGRLTRESKKWDALLKNFVRECKVDESWKHRRNNSEAILEFAAHERSSRPGVKKAADFIGTILTAAITKQDHTDTLAILQTTGVVGRTPMQIDFVASCIEQMETALKKPEKRS